MVSFPLAMWQRNLPSVDASAGNAHATSCCRCVAAQLLPSGTPPGPRTLPLVRGVAACGHKFPTILGSKFVSRVHLICTPHFPTFVLDGRLQNLRTNSDETLQQEFSSEHLFIWPAQNCRALLLDTRLAAAAAERVEFATALRQLREKILAQISNSETFVELTRFVLERRALRLELEIWRTLSRSHCSRGVVVTIRRRISMCASIPKATSTSSNKCNI